MKYCMSGRQPENVLRKADEIKLELRDWQALPDYIEKYNDKTIILEFTKDVPNDFNWDLIQAYSEKMEGKFHCALADLSMIETFSLQQRGIKYYYKYSVQTFFEAAGLADLGVSQLLVGTALMADLPNLRSLRVPLRAIPNLAYEPYIKRKNGIIGGWIRPEDVDKYGEFIAVFEFYAPKNLRKEQALYRVYADQKTWPGNLSQLIDYLDFDFDNRLLWDEKHFAQRRMTCGQKCLKGSNCKYCYSQLNIVETHLKPYLEYKK